MGQGTTGGKHAPVSTPREFKPNTAGTITKGLGGGKPLTREFKGSGVRSYTYTRIINGIEVTRTFRAHSVKEANKIAASEGFKTTDREIKRRKKRKR